MSIRKTNFNEFQEIEGIGQILALRPDVRTVQKGNWCTRCTYITKELIKMGEGGNLKLSPFFLSYFFVS